MSVAARLRVVVLGEGHDERGVSGSTRHLDIKPAHECGALEILVRRLLFQAARPGARWPGLGQDDGIDILAHPEMRRRLATHVVLTNEQFFGEFLVTSIANKERRPADIFIAACDGDRQDRLASFQRIVARARTIHGAHVLATLVPVPQLQSWLARKRAIERAFNREHCTVPEPDEVRLRTDAKAELRRQLSAAEQDFGARAQARVAATISDDELAQFEAWSGWAEARSAIQGLWMARTTALSR